MSSKHSFRGKPKKQATNLNPNQMMNQFQKAQTDMSAAQAELEKEEFSYTAGGGALEVVITGHQRLKSITISADLLDPEEKETLESLLISTINQAIEGSQSRAAEKMEGITSGLGVNDLLGSLGGLAGLGL